MGALFQDRLAVGRKITHSDIVSLIVRYSSVSDIVQSGIDYSVIVQSVGQSVSKLVTAVLQRENS
jgi:hypothetical protein